MADREVDMPFPQETDPDIKDSNREALHLRKMIALGELACGITHDFRNILQTVLSTLELIESYATDPANVRRLTASAIRASERGAKLTNRLLAFSHQETTAVRSANLLSSLQNATETLTRTIGAKMNVQIDPPPSDLWQAVIDPTELELALINLGINARDAMPNGGLIRLTARNTTIPQIERRTTGSLVKYDGVDRRGPRLSLPGGDYVSVVVADTGVGMDEATLAKAATPFFTTKPVGKGTGLGLTMAQTLAAQGSGELRVISKPGRGTTVEMWLPRAAASNARSSSVKAILTIDDSQCEMIQETFMGRPPGGTRG